MEQEEQKMRRKERKNMENRGKTCKEPGCRFHAVVKGYCINCYSRRWNRENKK